MIRPSYEEVKAYREKGDYRRVPVSTELLSDFITPIQALRKLKNVSNHVYLLESAEAKESWGRFTFLGYDPTEEIQCRNGQLTISDVTVETRDPGKYIRQLLSRYKAPRLDYLPPFAGGLVGY